MLTLLIFTVSVLVAVLVFGVNEIRMRDRAIQSITAEVRTCQRQLAQTRDELAVATSSWRELVLRDGDRALLHLTDIASREPWTSDGNGGSVCFFCGVLHTQPAGHRSNCRYMVASRFLDRHEEAVRLMERR